MKRASYRAAIAWIAENDSVGDDDPLEILNGFVTVVLIADLFDRDPSQVAIAVLRYRQKAGLTKHTC